MGNADRAPRALAVRAWAIAAVLLLGGSRPAFAQERAIAVGPPPRWVDPCPKQAKPGEWVRLPDGAPPPPSRPKPGSAGIVGRRLVVARAGAGEAAFDLCALRWTTAGAAPTSTPRASNEGIEIGGARLVPAHDPRRSSYDGLAGARLVFPSGKELRLPAAGAPSPRTYHALAFDGRRLIVWGGLGPGPDGRSQPLGDGAVLEVWSRRWRPMSAVSAPAPRFLPVAVWTGRELVIWGGGAGVPGGEPTLFGDGAAYDPARNVWSPMSSENAPSPRWKPVTVWTGRAMVLTGGGDSLIPGGARGRTDAYVYEPPANRWSAVEGSPDLAEAHWIRSFVDRHGRVLFVDTHVLRSFGVLDPAARRFHTVPLPETLRERSGVAVAWTGSRLLLWGGYRQQPGYANPCRDFKGPGGCDPPSPEFATFSDLWAYAPPDPGPAAAPQR